MSKQNFVFDRWNKQIIIKFNNYLDKKKTFKKNKLPSSKLLSSSSSSSVSEPEILETSPKIKHYYMFYLK